MPWNAQSLQTVWFTTRPPSEAADRIFEQMLGVRPTGYQSGQSMPPMMGQTSSATGALHGLNWTLSIQPGRIDLAASPEMQAPGPGAEFIFPVIQNTDERLRLLVELSGRMPNEFPFSRIAMLVNFVEPVETHDGANAVVADLLGADFVRPGMSDFLVRLNKRKALDTLPEIDYNRVLVWKVDAFQQVEVAFGAGGVTPMGIAPSSNVIQVFAASLQIDLNTVPGRRVFTAPEAQAIFAEMCEEARRLEADKRPASLSV